MKTLLILATLISASAFAEVNPSSTLAQALIDNSDSIDKLKTICPHGMVNSKSEQRSPGVFVHTVRMEKMSRGDGRKNCEVTIVQDYTPTYSDGGIAYSFNFLQ